MNWTNEEVTKLEKLYARVPVKHLVSLFPGRTEIAIVSKVRRYRIRNPGKNSFS